MHKLLLIGLCLVLLTSCKEKVQSENIEDDTAQGLATDKWPKKLNVNAEANAILGEWPEFKALEISYDALYKASNKEDLSLTIENIIEEQKVLEDSQYPFEFDKPQIKSRQKVFKTYVLRVKGDLIYRLDPQQSVIEMIEAYNAFRKQFDVVLSNTLDSTLILNE